jgi:hypothetical protein
LFAFSSEPLMTVRFRFSFVVIGIGYLILLASLVGSMFWVRMHVAEMFSDEAWNEWRADTQRQSVSHGPVQRAVAESAEPPAVVLLRENFWACLITLVVILSVIYFTFAWLLQGAISPHRPQPAAAKSAEYLDN